MTSDPAAPVPTEDLREQVRNEYGRLEMFKKHEDLRGILSTKERIRELETQLAERRRERRVAMGVALHA